MFEEGKYYVCTSKKTINDDVINCFIKEVFGSASKYYTLNGTYYGTEHYKIFPKFTEGNIYYSPSNDILADDNGTPIFFKDLNDYEFKEIECDMSEVSKLIKKIKKCNIRINPKLCMNDVIWYECKITVCGKKNTGHAIAISITPIDAIHLAYKEARKNLLTKTKLFKSITNINYGIY